MLCIEIMYLGLTINFILLALFSEDPKGQLYALFILVLVAGESALGLGLLIVLYRFGLSITFQNHQRLRG